MKDTIAIKVTSVSKAFRIPHEKVTSVKGAVVSVFKSKSFEEFKALDDISFEVKKGEFFGIIGRNGSGKSTLLKILAGIYKPDKGKVEIDGMISPFLELGIGFNPELSGRDNVYLNATVLGMTKKQIDEKFDSIVKFSELERFIDQKLKNYSSGMQVRLAFSVSIHANRDILLMDEVLAVGDSNFQRKCIKEFVDYKEKSKTVILVTHDIEIVRKYCDRALFLNEGKITALGETHKITDDYLKKNISDMQSNANSKKSVLGIHIKKILLQGASDKEMSIFKTGDPMKIKVLFDSLGKEVFNIGVGLYSDNGTYVFGYNTQMDDFLIKPGSSEVELSFGNMPLLSGNYYLNIVCFGKYEQDYFEFAGKIKELTFFSSNEKVLHRGLISISHNWK